MNRGTADETAPPDLAFQSFMERPEHAHYVEGNVDYHDSIFSNAGNTALWCHLKRYDREYAPPTPDGRALFMAELETWNARFRPFNRLPFPDVDELADVRIDRARNPGYPWCVGPYNFRSKGEAYTTALPRAEERLEKALNGIEIHPRPCVAGGRGKVTLGTRALQGDIAAGRMVAIPAVDDNILQGATSQRVTDYLVEIGDSSLSVGWSQFGGGCLDLERAFNGVHPVISDDMSSYDSGIEPWRVDAVIEKLRSWFQGDSPDRDMYWNYISEGLIRGSIIMPNGSCLKRQGGTTTGHDWNSLVQSIIKLCCTRAYYRHLGAKHNVGYGPNDVIVRTLGDDGVHGTRNVQLARHVSLTDYAHWTYYHYHDVVHKRKSKETENFASSLICDEPDGAQYLGKYFHDGIPFRPMLETLLRLKFPEYGTRSLEDSYTRGVGNYIDAAGSIETADLLDKYLSFLEDQGARFNGWSPWASKHLLRDYTGLRTLEKVLPARRISRREWLILIRTGEPL
jgi:hypothetical protein